MKKKSDGYGSFELVESDEVFKVKGARTAKFLRPSADFVGSQTTPGRPEELMFDEAGYLIPDPVEIYDAMMTSSAKRKLPLHASRQSLCILQNILDHQHAMHMSGGIQEERYLTLDGPGGVGKSYTIEWAFAKLGVPAVIQRIPESGSEASRVLFGEPNAINPYKTTAGKVGATVETAKAVYRGRGITNPAAINFITQRDKSPEQQQIAAQRLYMALHPNGWAKSDPEKYNAYWMKVAEIEGISSDRPFIPKLGLFERCTRNGMVLFLDEINRLPKEVKDQMMRALEGNKDLELNGGRVIKAYERKGMIIAAMNGERMNFGTSKLCAAQSRRSKTVTVPEITGDDVKASIAYLLTGESNNPELVKCVQESAPEAAKNSVCRKDYLETLLPGGLEQPKLDAIEEFARMHMFMDEQMCLVEQGKGWMKGQNPKLRELLPSGPTLLKSFFTRATQLIGKEPGVIPAMDALKQAFEENYIEPLITRGVPREQVESNVNFGASGKDQSGKVNFSNKSLFELASCFAPMDLTKEAEELHLRNREILEDTIVPCILDVGGEKIEVLTRITGREVTEENKREVVETKLSELRRLGAMFPDKQIKVPDLDARLKAQKLGSTVVVTPLSPDSPLMTNRGDSELSMAFMEHMTLLKPKWDQDLDPVPSVG